MNPTYAIVFCISDSQLSYVGAIPKSSSASSTYRTYNVQLVLHQSQIRIYQLNLYQGKHDTILHSDLR